jgi:hypothetical protein
VEANEVVKLQLTNADDVVFNLPETQVT